MDNNLYSICGKCKISKELNKYRWCYQCVKSNKTNYVKKSYVYKTYDFCSICEKPKTTEKEKQFQKCYSCNNFDNSNDF